MDELTLFEAVKNAEDLKNYREIYDALINEKLIFFVGAGASRLCGLLGWDDLTTKLLYKLLPDEKEREIINSKTYDNKRKITIAFQKATKEDCVNDFYDIMGEALSVSNVKKSQPFAEYQEDVYEIISQFHALFLTTNADHLLEEALGGKVFTSDSLDIGQFIYSKKPLLYLHGRFDYKNYNKNNKLIFTVDKYIEKYNDNTTINFLKNIFSQNYVVVFVGYGLGEYELIDYMLTKSNIKLNVKQKKFFIIQPYTEDEDLLFKVDRLYFDALGVEVLPYYKKSEKNYTGLKAFLSIWLDEYKLSSNYVIFDIEEINKYVSMPEMYSKQLIARHLKRKRINIEAEKYIVKKIVETDLSEQWLEIFNNKKLYTYFNLQRHFDKLTEFDFPLINLLEHLVVRNKNELGNMVACRFFKAIFSKKNMELCLKLGRGFLSTVANIILAMPDRYVNDKIIKAFGRIIDNYSWMIIYNKEASRVSVWNEKNFNAIMQIYVNSIDTIDSFNDLVLYEALLFIKEVERQVSSNWQYISIFKAIVDLFEKSTNKEYNRLLGIYNLDYMSNESENGYLTSYFVLLKRIFKNISFDDQKKQLAILVSSDNKVLNKIAIYLIRTYKICFNFICNVKLFNNHYNVYELYQCIKLIRNNDDKYGQCEESLFEIIKDANFGFDASDKNCVNTIKKYRLAFFQLLGNSASLNSVKQLEMEGVRPDDIESLDVYGVVHVENVEPPQINLSKFESLKEDQFIQFILENAKYDFLYFDLVNQIVLYLISADELKFENVLFEFKKANNKIIHNFLFSILNNFDKINIYRQKIVFNYIIDILSNNEKNNIDSDLNIIKYAFWILSKIGISDDEADRKLLKAYYKYCNEYNDFDEKVSENAILFNLINSTPFFIHSCLINHYSYKFSKHEEIIEMHIIDSDLSKIGFANYAVVRYIFCFYTKKLLHVSNNNMDILKKLWFNNNKLDLNAHMISCFNGKITDYFCNNIQDIVTQYWQDIIECKDKELLANYYKFIATAFVFDKIKIEKILPLYNHYDFINNCIYVIMHFATEDNNLGCNKLIKFFAHVNENERNTYAKDLLRLLLLYNSKITNPVKEVIELIINISEKCSEKDYFHLDFKELDSLFLLDKNLAHDFMRKVLVKFSFISLDDFIAIKTCYSNNEMLTEFYNLLNILYDAKIIDLDIYDKIMIATC